MSAHASASDVSFVVNELRGYESADINRLYPSLSTTFGQWILLMELKDNRQLFDSPTVANCRMNRERNLRGTNSYAADLKFDPLEFLVQRNESHPDNSSNKRPLRWLDLCCGRGRALIQSQQLFQDESVAIEIIGIDLVSMFDSLQNDRQTTARLQLIEATLDEWNPPAGEAFDLITCVHGLHYIGDKLNLIRRAASWLKPDGRFVAHLDPNNIRHTSKKPFSKSLLEFFHSAEFEFDDHLLSRSTSRLFTVPWNYLGADDSAGPNFTGQPSVNSWYA